MLNSVFFFFIILGYEKTEKEFLVIFELCLKGSFWDLIYQKKYRKEIFSPTELLHYASEVAAGLNFLHKKNIYHRDIKSANVLVDGDSSEGYYKIVKLGDFNISTNRVKSNTRLGTAQWMVK